MGCAPRQVAPPPAALSLLGLSQQGYSPISALLQHASKTHSPSSSNSASPSSPATEYRDLNDRVQTSTARVRRLLNGGTVEVASPSPSQFSSPQDPGGGWGSPEGSAEQQFDMMDTNGDGVISREEFAAAAGGVQKLYDQFKQTLKGHTTPPAVGASRKTSPDKTDKSSTEGRCHSAAAHTVLLLTLCCCLHCAAGAVF